MNSRKHFFTTAFIIATTLVFSCTFTKTKIINPAFNLTLDSISRDINSFVVTPQKTLTGKEISVNGKVTTELTVNLINSENLTNDEDEQKKLGESIAVLLKNALKDPNSFSDYKVLFTKRTMDGAVTKSTYVSYAYKSEALKNYVQIVSVGKQFDPSVTEAIGNRTFSINDPKIVSVFSYYNNVPGSPVKLNVYKNTDSGMLLLTSRDQGQILAGNNYVKNELTTADFYKIKELGQGKYKIEYSVSDTAAGSKDFIVE